MRRSYKDPALQSVYESITRLARDKTSTLYFDGRPYPHGSNIRIYFWRGVEGMRPLGLQQGTQGWAAWMAGRDFATESKRNSHG